MKRQQRSRIGLYLRRQAATPARYLLEQLVQWSCGGIPTIVGIAIRSVVYRLILEMHGLAAIEANVRLAFAGNIRLNKGVYLDNGVYLHATPGGIEIGENTMVMNHAELHVYNFRDLPHSRIKIGKNCLISEFNVLRGQGGIIIGDNVYTGPHVQMAAVEHVYRDRAVPIIQQGITAQGIHVEDNAWIGAGAIILDGVCIGEGAVVGAGAVVAQDVPAHTVVAGVPAKVLKEIDAPKSPPNYPVYAEVGW